MEVFARAKVEVFARAKVEVFAKRGLSGRFVHILTADARAFREWALWSQNDRAICDHNDLIGLELDNCQ